MDPILTGVLTSLITAGVAGGVASWGSQKATKAVLNGTKERTERIETKLDKHIDDSQINKLEVAERLTKIETKLED